jgi:hypothetical protein
LLPQDDAGQGDQIGRIFANWVIVYFGQFYENYKSSTHILGIFSAVKFIHKCLKKCVGLHFGRFFDQTHLVTLMPEYFLQQSGSGAKVQAFIAVP